MFASCGSFPALCLPRFEQHSNSFNSNNMPGVPGAGLDVNRGHYSLKQRDSTSSGAVIFEQMMKTQH
jgi:hypothetical protein